MNSKPSVAPIGSAALALVPLGVLINLGVGTIVHVLKLPVFLDAIGTIIVTMLIGWKWGALSGVLSFVIGGMLVNPVMPWFSGTQVVVALATAAAARVGGFKNVFRTVVSGIAIGVAAGVASAPVIIWLFGGITGSGSGLVTSFLLASGKKIVESVLLTGLSCEPVDKVAQALLAFWVLRSLPRSIRRRLEGHGYLTTNYSAQ